MASGPPGPGDLAAEPLEVHPATVDVGIGVPQSRNGGLTAAEDPVLLVGSERGRGGGKHRRRAGHVNADTLARGPAGQEAGRRVTAARNDRHSRLQTTPAGRRGGQLADDRLGFDDLRELGPIDAERLAQVIVPARAAVVGEPGEVKVRPVDERPGAVQPAEPHGRVAARLHEGGNAAVDALVGAHPPEDLRAVVEAGRAPGLGQHPVAGLSFHALDLLGAAGIEPGVVWGNVAPVAADTEDPRHLTVDADSRDRGLVDAGLADALPDGPANRVELVLGVLFDDPGTRPVQLGGSERLGEALALEREQGRLGPLRANVDADEGFHVRCLPRPVAWSDSAAMTIFIPSPARAVSYACSMSQKGTTWETSRERSTLPVRTSSKAAR